MSVLEATYEELKTLPPAKLEEAASYIRNLKLATKAEAKAALERAFGCLTSEEAAEMERSITANCERIDASQW